MVVVHWWRVFPRAAGGKTEKTEAPGAASSPLQFSAGGESPVTCKQKRNTQGSRFYFVFFFLLDQFRFFFFRSAIKSFYSGGCSFVLQIAECWVARLVLLRWKRESWVCHRLKEMMTVLPRRWICSVVAAVEGNRRRNSRG